MGRSGTAPPQLQRWTVDPASQSTSVDDVDGRFHEFPRHDPRVGTEKHRYAYTAGVSVKGSDRHGATHKVDYDTGEVVERSHGAGRRGGEPIFVPRQGSTAEDDGWLLVMVHDATTDTSDLVVLDAGDFAGDDVARVHIPRRVPHGFHGAWVPDGDG